MKRFTPIFFVLATCFLEFGCDTASHTQPWDVLPPESAATMFSYVAEFVKTSPRDAGTVNAGRASQWIAQEIRKMGLKPKADTWTENAPSGEKTFSNIYIDIPGKSKEMIIIGSHYDTKPGISDDFQGANDGGSSTGILLGLINHLSQRKPDLNYTLRFAFFDGEEGEDQVYREGDGLNGSKRMAAQAVKNSMVSPLRAVIILDMVGAKNLHIEIPRNVTPWLAEMALKLARDNPNDTPRVSLAKIPILDDHWPFLQQGFGAVNLINFEYGSEIGKQDYWHTAEDTIDKISPESLRKTGNLTLKMILHMETDYAEQNASAKTNIR